MGNMPAGMNGAAGGPQGGSTDAMTARVMELMKKGMNKEMAMKKVTQEMLAQEMRAGVGAPAEGTPGEESAEDPAMEAQEVAGGTEVPTAPGQAPAPGGDTPAPGSPEDVKRKAMIAEMVKMGLK